jgi:hypothetical protein
MMRFVVDSKGRRKRKSENQMPEVKVAEAPEIEIRATLINRFYPPLLVEIKFFRHPLLSDTRFRHSGSRPAYWVI